MSKWRIIDNIVFIVAMGVTNWLLWEQPAKVWLTIDVLFAAVSIASMTRGVKDTMKQVKDAFHE